MLMGVDKRVGGVLDATLGVACTLQATPRAHPPSNPELGQLTGL